MSEENQTRLVDIEKVEKVVHLLARLNRSAKAFLHEDLDLAIKTATELVRLLESLKEVKELKEQDIEELYDIGKYSKGPDEIDLENLDGKMNYAVYDNVPDTVLLHLGGEITPDVNSFF